MGALSIRDLNVWYGKEHALKKINAEIAQNQITAVIGPSGCGKSTLLKSLNRLLELNEQVRLEGEVWLDGEDIYRRDRDVTEVRTRIGLLAQKPFPLPMSIYDNVAYGPRIHGLARGNLDQIVQAQLGAGSAAQPGNPSLCRAAAASLSGAHLGCGAGGAAL